MNVGEVWEAIKSTVSDFFWTWIRFFVDEISLSEMPIWYLIFGVLIAIIIALVLYSGFARERELARIRKAGEERDRLAREKRKKATEKPDKYPDYNFDN